MTRFILPFDPGSARRQRWHPARCPRCGRPMARADAGVCWWCDSGPAGRSPAALPVLALRRRPIIGGSA